jgi:hypothetical protein
MLRGIAYPVSTMLNRAVRTTPPAPTPPAPPLPWDIQEEWYGETATLYCNGKKATVRSIAGYCTHFEVTEDGAILCEGIHPSLGAAQQAAQAAIQ